MKYNRKTVPPIAGNQNPNRPAIEVRPHKAVKRARILSADNIETAFRHIEETSHSPYSDEAKFALSVFAGLRVSEIADLTTSAFLDADGKIGPNIIVGANLAKGGRERIIPIHPRLRQALQKLRKAHPHIDYVSFSHWGRIKKQSPSALKDFFSKLYREIGLEGCSSHSGRRTFITGLAKLAAEKNRTLRDVQVLAGHSRLETTQIYIDPSDDYADLVSGLHAGNDNGSIEDDHDDDALDPPGGAA